MGATQLGFGTPWASSPYGVHAPQQLLQSLQQLVQLDYVQQQLLHLVPQRIQLLQQIQYLLQLVGGQQHQPFLPQGGFPISSFVGSNPWLGGTQGVQPQVFGGQPGYVM
jgi:hypothetical protein